MLPAWVLRPVMWDAGGNIPIPLSTRDGEVLDINDAGAAAGYFVNPETGRSIPFRWTPATGAQDLPMSLRSQGTVHAMFHTHPMKAGYQYPALPPGCAYSKYAEGLSIADRTQANADNLVSCNRSFCTKS
jgi:hypothetical protein